MNLAIAVVIGIVVGFIAGAILSSRLIAEARAVESRLSLALRLAKYDIEDIELKRAQLEKDAKDSFEVFSNDVEAIVKRLEALEQHVDQKICSVINPGGQS